jgi:hypothetical protein
MKKYKGSDPLKAKEQPRHTPAPRPKPKCDLEMLDLIIQDAFEPLSAKAEMTFEQVYGVFFDPPLGVFPRIIGLRLQALTSSHTDLFIQNKGAFWRIMVIARHGADFMLNKARFVATGPLPKSHKVIVEADLESTAEALFIMTRTYEQCQELLDNGIAALGSAQPSQQAYRNLF